MDGNSIIIFWACLIVLLLIGNSILGGVLIYIVNIIGSSFGFHIGLNVGTSIFAGILGVPGVIFLIVLKLII